jgi:hypothetical protein
MPVAYTRTDALRLHTIIGTVPPRMEGSRTLLLTRFGRVRNALLCDDGTAGDLERYVTVLGWPVDTETGGQTRSQLVFHIRLRGRKLPETTQCLGARKSNKSRSLDTPTSEDSFVRSVLLSSTGSVDSSGERTPAVVVQRCVTSRLPPATQQHPHPECAQCACTSRQPARRDNRDTPSPSNHASRSSTHTDLQSMAGLGAKLVCPISNGGDVTRESLSNIDFDCWSVHVI